MKQNTHILPVCILIAAMICISASAAEASEVILGVVTSVNTERGRITLKVIDSSNGAQGQPAAESVVVTIDPKKIPAGLSPGDTVRVWGAFTSAGKKIFRGSSIRKGNSGSGSSDPTGVRSRLGKGGQGNGNNAGGKGSGRR